MVFVASEREFDKLDNANQFVILDVIEDHKRVGNERKNVKAMPVGELQVMSLV